MSKVNKDYKLDILRFFFLLFFIFISYICLFILIICLYNFVFFSSGSIIKIYGRFDIIILSYLPNPPLTLYYGLRI